ncbi:hypothetical protein ACH52_0208 [Eubacterium limosum]|nr:hypothetical protein ACH52_0208 [Eubacterium limosum]
MSLFSERLKSVISKTGMPIYALAKKAGVNRPMIHKSQQGDSIPSDEFIEKLSDAMMLTNLEKKELLSLAERARMGEALYLKRQAVLNVLSCLCKEFDEMDLVALWKNKTPEHISGGYMFLKDCKQIEHVLLEMFQDKIHSAKEEKIYIYLPKHAKELFSIIYHLWSSNEASHIQLTQFIGLEKEYHSDESAVHNLALISYALNFCLMPEKSIKVRYYYLNYPENMDLPAMPYYIKTENDVLALSTDLNVGVYYSGGTMYDFYDQVIKTRLENSKPLIESVESTVQILDYKDPTHLIECIPCISAIVTDEMLDTFIRPEIPGRETLLNMLKSFYHEIQHNNKHPISFFQIKKLEKFMKDGIIPTVPSAWVRPAVPEERRKIAQSILNNMKNSKKRIYYAINPEKLRILADAEVVLTEKDGVMIRHFVEDTATLKIVWIRESSCIEAFSDFFNYLPGSNLVLSQDEMKKRVEALLTDNR